MTVATEVVGWRHVWARRRCAFRRGDEPVAVVDTDYFNTLLVAERADVDLELGGILLPQLRRGFVITAQSFFDYEDSDLNLLFATLLPRASFESTGQQILDLERRQRLVGAGVIIVAFVLLFFLLSSRINRLLRRISNLSRRALEIPGRDLDERGNQLLILEDWIRDFVQLVMRAREEMRRQHETELQQTEKLRVAIMDASLDAAARAVLNRAWEKLPPWPDSVAGLTALKSSYAVAPCSNGSIALMTRLARYARLPWDCILGADIARAEAVNTFMPSMTGVAQAGSGFGAFSTSTRHIRQLAATDRCL